ncbi:MAG: hypothetical protein ACRDRR_25310 [Pseudonocardiaceae bacterium]
MTSMLVAVSGTAQVDAAGVTVEGVGEVVVLGEMYVSALSRVATPSIIGSMSGMRGEGADASR